MQIDLVTKVDIGKEVIQIVTERKILIRRLYSVALVGSTYQEGLK